MGLPMKDFHSNLLSGTFSTKIQYQMKAEVSWEKDGRSAVKTWEKGEKRLASRFQARDCFIQLELGAKR